MFDDYFVYGGQEIINGPRTKAYLEHLQPTLSLGTSCCDCDPLAAAMGDAPYATPAQDDAEWFNPYAPETGGFYGLLPLAAEGFEDSTWQVNIIDLMGDGSISGRGRRAGRDLRFKVLAVAESEKAMSSGLAWLREALGSEGCGSGDCGGAQLCYLTDCPACCAPDAPEALTTVDHLDYRAMSSSAAAAAGAADWLGPTPVTAVLSAGQRYAHWPAPFAQISRTLDGLVPGAAYRISLDFGGAMPQTEITVSVPGARERLEPRTVDWAFGDTAAPAGGVVSWEFIAVECTHRIVITSTDDLSVGFFEVALSNLDSVAYSGQPSSYPSHATPWTAPLATNATYLVTQPSPGQWVFRAATGTASVAAGAGKVRTGLTGLTPGRTYRVSVLATSNLGAVATPGRIQVASAANKVLANKTLPAVDLSSGFGGWATVEFVATDPVGSLIVENSTAVTVGTTLASALVTAIHSAVVEETDPAVELPDPNDPLRRYLRDVVLTSGPTVTAVYPSYTAVMKEIEWTMRANVPDPLGEDVPISSTLGAGRWVVPEVACSLGDPVRTNYFTTPSGEYGVAGWAVPAGSTITNPASTTARSGSKVVRVTQTVADTAARGLPFPAIPTVEGHPWTFTVPVRSSVAGRRIQINLLFAKGASPMGSASRTYVTTDSLTDWQTISVSTTVPPGATSVIPSITLLSPGTWVANEYVEFDAVMLAREYGQRAYFDGDSLYATWSGTPGNSNSVYQRTSAAVVFDPACPPPPPPPRPPAIVNPCVTIPANWIRYVLEVPALAVAASPRAAPTITLTTGTADARGVRVRVYANPSSGPIEEIDPCSYCGEFMVSYLPASSSLTVDAADKTATIVTKTGSQSALGLLYGSDGGPMTWPLLGCTVPYLLTLDVDAAAPPLIAASLSVTPIF